MKKENDLKAMEKRMVHLMHEADEKNKNHILDEVKRIINGVDCVDGRMRGFRGGKIREKVNAVNFKHFAEAHNKLTDIVREMSAKVEAHDEMMKNVSKNCNQKNYLPRGCGKHLFTGGMQYMNKEWVKAKMGESSVVFDVNSMYPKKGSTVALDSGCVVLVWRRDVLKDVAEVIEVLSDLREAWNLCDEMREKGQIVWLQIKTVK